MKDVLGIFLNKLRKFNFADLVSKDWLLKFISLVLAVILWHYVGGEDRVDKNVMIPIEIINLPRDLVISNQFKKEIEVTVSGPRSMILEMTSKAITRQVDLSSATPGTMVIENDTNHIPVPRGITVQRVQPSSIILSLDKLIQKKFPISAKTAGKVADGYYLKSLKMDPDVISITGPLTTLSQVDELFTKQINLDGVKKSIQLQVPLQLEPAIVELIGETSVTADLTVVLETATKTLDEMEVHVVLDGVKRQVKPATVRVTANFPKKLLTNQVDPRSLLVVMATRQPNDDKLQVEAVPKADVELPIEILSIIPDQVMLVDANPKPSSTKSPVAEQVGENGVGKKSIDKIIDDLAPKAEDSDARDGAGTQNVPFRVIKNEKSKRKIIE